MTDATAFTYVHLWRDDVRLLRELTRVFGDAFEDTETYLGRAPSDAYPAPLLAKPHFIALCALRGTTVIGGLVAYQLEKFEQERSEIYIYDLAVDAACRRRGVATGLIETLRQIAADRGAYVIFVQADLVDAPAVALYRKLGIEETAHHYDIAVARKA